MSKVGGRYRSASSNVRGERAAKERPLPYGGGRLLPRYDPDRILEKGPPPAPLLTAGSAAAPVALVEEPARDAETRPTLYARRKALYPVAFWLGMAVSVLAHWAVFRFAPPITAEIATVATAPLTAVELPPEVDIPPPPAQIARPALPVVSSRMDISEDITIAPTVFSDFTPPAIAPPPRPEVQPASTDAPSFTPYTRAPVLQNPDEVARAITANYPRTLRDAEVGGDVVLWFYIDETGRVLDTRVAEGSGYEAMDQAAVSVAGVFRFRPAYNRDLPAKVWVQIPIMFRVRGR